MRARRINRSKAFHEVLYMTSKDRLSVRQEQAFGPIHVANRRRVDA
jgi:hypothetical protein